MLFTNDEGISIIKTFEGLRDIPYVCPAGYLTIGYGHVIKDGEKIPDKITEAQALKLLMEDIAIAEKAVKRNVKVRLNNNQFSALVSFVFNLGEGNFKNSTLLKEINRENHMLATAEFAKWIYSGKNKLIGLLRRRLTEALLYVK